MLSTIAVVGGLTLATLAVLAALFVRWGVGWGSTPEERAAPMTGDAYFSGDAPAYVAMTRAIDIAAPPETVWPWLAQTGRGAGWYSWDTLDNGRRASARQIVSWIPAPQLGDATAIGYLRDLNTGRQMSWWAPGVHYPGVDVSLVVDMQLSSSDRQSANPASRLVIRISADAFGPMAHPTLWIFRLIDSIMATRQLACIKRFAEAFGTRTSDPDRPETGDRKQYQLYQTIYASGEWSGTYGREQATHWRQLAARDGLV